MQFSIAWVSLLFASVLTQTHAAFLQQTPMARVASLLKEMKTRIESDGQAEQTSYDKYACWCEDTLGRKAKDISDAKEQITSLQALIKELEGDIGAHGADIKQLEKDIAANVESQREASGVRRKDSRDFEGEKYENEQCAGALEAAIKVLTGAGEKKGFLETMKEAELLSVVAQVRGVLERPVLTQKVSDKDMELVKRFVERPADFVGSRSGSLSASQIANNPFGDYAPQSTQIQGILKGMYDAFTSDLEKDNAEEAEAQKSFEALMATKRKELATLQTTLDQHQVDIAAKTNKKAESNSLLDDTKVQLDADERFFSEAKQGCKSKASEWATRTRLRTEELSGVAQAIGILTDPESTRIFTNSTEAFVQVGMARSQVHGEARAGAYGQLARMAQMFNSLSLAKIAVEVKSGGHFDRVIASIDLMIASLRKEEQEDIEHRDRCERAEGKNSNDLEDIGAAVNREGQKISLLENEQGKLLGQVDDLETEINRTRDEIAEALSMRNSEVDQFRQVLKDDADAVALLVQTLVTLRRFYKRNDIPISLIAEEPEYTNDPDKAPDTTWSGANYGGRKSETRGVVAILEMIKEDIEKEMKVGREDDATGERQYEKERGAMQDTLDAQTGLKLATEKELAEVQANMADSQEEKTARGKDLQAENALTTAIESDCSWVRSHFELRRTKRKAEIDGLVEAKGYLAGVDDGI